MSILMAGALAVDFQREFTHRIAERRISLEEEAKTIAAAIPTLTHHGQQAIQDFLDSVCGSLKESESPGHHVAVLWKGTIIQAEVHGRSTPAFYEAVRRASASPDGRAGYATQELVAASSAVAGETVYVSGDVTGIRQIVLRENAWRLSGLLLAGTIAAGIVNVVLYRGLASPLERLVATVGRIAQGELGLQAGRFATAELAALAAAINEMSQSLAANQRERSRQLEKARRLQEHLLKEWPTVRGMKIARLFQPATEVTGDYTDLSIAPDGSAVLCIADVSGHGIPAAMGAAMLKTMFLEALRSTSCPADVLQRLNARFGDVVLPGDFASMFVARWDAQRGCLEYAIAGHEPAWLRHLDGAYVPMTKTGHLLGVQSEETWPSETVQIRDHDRLLLVTDGVTECMNLTGELFGRDRVAAVLHDHSSAPIQDVVSSLERELESHRQGAPLKDDTTIVLIEFRGDEP
ncbi:MAG: serine/threonine-protein phosphatase [Planctomycetia bacterium]|nr:serine/threonine-protein phosphatase [Planctomycetia bacterium]